MQVNSHMSASFSGQAAKLEIAKNLSETKKLIENTPMKEAVKVGIVKTLDALQSLSKTNFSVQQLLDANKAINQSLEAINDADANFLEDVFEDLRPVKKGKHRIQDFLMMGQMAVFNHRFESSKSGGYKALPKTHKKLTMGAMMLDLVANLSPAKIMEMMEGLLERGLDDIGDVAILMNLLGSLEGQIPPSLLKKIAEALQELVDQTIQNATSFEDVKAFLDMMQQFTSSMEEPGADIGTGPEGVLGSIQSMMGAALDGFTAGIETDLDVDQERLSELENVSVDHSKMKFTEVNPQFQQVASIKGEGVSKRLATDSSVRLEKDEHEVKPIDILDKAASIFDKVAYPFVSEVLDIYQKYMENHMSQQIDNMDIDLEVLDKNS